MNIHTYTDFFLFGDFIISWFRVPILMDKSDIFAIGHVFTQLVEDDERLVRYKIGVPLKGSAKYVESSGHQTYNSLTVQTIYYLLET